MRCQQCATSGVGHLPWPAKQHADLGDGCRFEEPSQPGGWLAGDGAQGYANTSQAKGRVQRLNGTLQHRLVKELRLRGIQTMDAENAYAPTFMPPSTPLRQGAT